MMKHWISGLAVLGCALLALSIAQSRTRAQDQGVKFEDKQAGILTLGPAIRVLVTEPLSRRELRKLVTDSRTARDHPDLAEYYRIEADRLQADAERDGRLARAFGDTVPLSGDSHFSVGRDTFYYHVRAKGCLRQAQADRLLAALNRQAAEREGCFSCHSFHGRGGKKATDLAIEGSRCRSKAWLIRYFKDPQTYAGKALSGLTDQQLEVLATFLEYQKEK
ncbi:MAG: hypothetical protein M1404_02195 [Acidobacteria bacterium]|nr:hypothetical protein [Acidobacteriota bacterium]